MLFIEPKYKDLTVEQLKTTIRSCIREINKAKKALETISCIPINIEDAEASLWVNREFKEEAIRELESRGIAYEYTKKELKAKEFQEKLPMLKKITIEAGDEEPIGLYTVIFDNQKAYVYDYIIHCIDYDVPTNLPTRKAEKNKIIKVIDKEYVIKEIEKLYIGEWKNYYPNKSCSHNEESRTKKWDWRIKFAYSDGMQKTFSGIDEPYNFYDFIEIFELLDLIWQDDEE